MIDINVEVQSLDKLKVYETYVEKMLNMKTNVNFQKYIQNKILDLAIEMTNKLVTDETTNKDAIQLYRENHKIREYDGGFILYNDTMIEVNAKDKSGYPNEQFPIALAFEYGVGIVGQETNNSNAWQYDINNYGQKGWVYLINETTWQRTRGYKGFEIYRNIANEVISRITKWVIEYSGNEV